MATSSIVKTPTRGNRLDLRQEYALQFFDAQIIAGAERADCDTVYSEDMTDGERYGNVTVVHPFKA